MPGRHEPRENGATGGASVHVSAVVETDQLGAGCVVHEHASLAAGVVLGDGVSVGPGARLLGPVRVEREATIGANATVCSGVAIGRWARVEPGSVVRDDVPPYAMVRGNPARIVDYVDALPTTTELDLADDDTAETTTTGVAGVVLHRFTHARDLRGSLAAIEFAGLPFRPQRAYTVYAVPNESVRGAHAHRTCAQLLVCLSGQVNCVADDGTSRQEFRLSRRDLGLFIPPLVWGMQYGYTTDAVLLVLAEHPYDADDYVRDYEEFLSLVAAR